MSRTPTQVRRSAAPGPRPAVDPRMRARRREVARRRGRRRLVVICSLLGFTVLAVVALVLLHTQVLGARAITIKGSVHTPAAEIIAAGGLAGHPPLIDINPGATAAAIERLPWVRTASITRAWPDGLNIAITERRPVGVVATPTGGRWLVVDGAGRVVETLGAPPAGLVHVTVAGGPGVHGGWLSRRAVPALTVAATLPKAFSAQVGQVAADRQGAVTLTLDQPLTVSFGPPVDLKQKYEDIAAVLAGATLQAGDVINVTVPGAPSVGPNA